MRRALRIVVRVLPVVILLGLAALAALVARDVRAVERSLAKDDMAFVRFTGQRFGEHEWSTDPMLPFAERAFGVEDDLLFRRALEAFQRDARRQPNPYDYLRPTLVDDARAVLADAESADLPAALRSRAANLDGALTHHQVLQDPDKARALVRESMEDFRRAIAIDPMNEEAKHNLELLLRLPTPPSRLFVREENPLERLLGRGAPGAESRRGQGY
ncbi:MAG: hypothetical protein H0V79_12100 [Actinobacteria bacterium]|nr:hypothetical protein [Actinomycetota bacterium]